MHLLEAGENLIYICDLFGHSSVATTEIYTKTNPKIKEEQLKKHSVSVGTAQKYSENKRRSDHLVEKESVNWQNLMQSKKFRIP